MVLETLANGDFQSGQRHIARKTGYSIGLINAILKKLTKTGYVKAANLNKRQIQYLLTPRGLATASRQACTYLVRTVREYRQLQMQIESFFANLCKAGPQCVFVDGDEELKGLIRAFVQSSSLLSDISLVPNHSVDAVSVDVERILITSEGPKIDLSIRNPATMGGI
jgi:DNA-binding MarR family transcriptional regulator